MFAFLRLVGACSAPAPVIRQAILILPCLALACSSGEHALPAGETSGTVGHQGARVGHAGGASVSLPEGAVGQGQSVTVTLKTIERPSTRDLGAEPLGQAIQLGPEGHVFLRPVVVSLPFDQALVPTGAMAQVRILTAPASSGPFTPLPTTIDVAGKTARAETTHFSVFVLGVLAQSPDAAIDAVQGGPTIDAPTGVPGMAADGAAQATRDAQPIAIPDAGLAADASRSPDSSPPTAVDAGSPADAVPAPQGQVAVSPMVTVTRLARFVWSASPDQTLLDQARMGKPATLAEVRALTSSMLGDPRARALPADFVVWWLGLDRVTRVTLDRTRFPAFTPALATAALTEARLFASAVTLDEDGRLETLLTATWTFADRSLATHYGVSGVTGAAHERVALPPAQRAGLLTQTAALALGSSALIESPSKRGLLIFERLLCQPIPPPPVNVNNTPPMPSPSMSTRELWARHRQEPACAACHTLIDPAGFAFGNYDAAGAYRMIDAGKPIDASGQVNNVSPQLTFTSGVDLARKLAVHDQVRQCFARKWLEHALGRVPTDTDAASVTQIAGAGARSDWDIKALIAETAATPAFLAP